MISTKDLSCMLNTEALRRVCKGISALEIIMSKEDYIRYYSYNLDWDTNEEVFEMTNGSGQSMLVLFCSNGCVISGIDEELYDWERDNPKIENITYSLPNIFQEFMYGEPVKSLKSTFCIWTINGTNWSISDAVDMNRKDGSEAMLSILDGNAQTYVSFCKWYYEIDIPLDIAEKVYNGEVLTLDMINALNSKRDDIDTIKNELCEIGYPNTL